LLEKGVLLQKKEIKPKKIEEKKEKPKTEKAKQKTEVKTKKPAKKIDKPKKEIKKKTKKTTRVKKKTSPKKPKTENKELTEIVEEKKEEKKPAKKEKLKIMIIDDEKDILSSVEYVLKASNYEIVTVDNGKECFEILENEELPDLIILDIMMPVMSGWEIQRKIESNIDWKDIPIIFLTARTTSTAAEMCKRLGADYITKPFDIDDLKKRVIKILKERYK